MGVRWWWWWWWWWWWKGVWVRRVKGDWGLKSQVPAGLALGMGSLSLA